MNNPGSGNNDIPHGETNLGWGEEYGPWIYSKVPEPKLTTMLSNVASPKTIAGVDCITFQPYLADHGVNQDRYAVEDWELQNGTWKFLAIFDGHAGHETADYVVSYLPSLLKSTLASALQFFGPISSTAVSDVLRNSITAFDNSLAEDVFDLFPDGPESISNLTDEHIRKIINDQAEGGTNYAKVARCMQGSTVLVSLIDPSKENLWVASLGDCQAVIGVNNVGSQDWHVSVLSENHNAKEESEVAMIKQQHPDEEECVLRNRVLGGIAVTRAVGDHIFKLDRIWTTKVFLNANPGFQFTSARPEDLVPRIHTPPYLSNKSGVRHISLVQPHPPNSQTGETPESFLIMCSDGLLDQYEARELSDLNNASQNWMETASSRNCRLYSETSVYRNRAFRILREALGGLDADQVAQLLTVQMMGKWLDDITILVLPL